MRILFRTFLAAILMVSGGAPPALADGPLPELAGHRAIYDISLSRPDPAGAVVAIRGRLAVEVQDSCDGHTTNQRFWTEMMNADGENVVSDFTLSSWEAKDGSRFRFEMRNLLNGEVSEEYAGSAVMRGLEGGAVEMRKPEEETIALPKGITFPNQHLARIIRKALDGAPFASIRVFDGSGEEGLFETGAKIGRPVPPETGGNPLFAPLSGLRSWPVRIAFFPLKTKAEEPQYEIGFRLFENGVSGDITLDYGEYAMKGVLRQLEMLPGGC